MVSAYYSLDTGQVEVPPARLPPDGPVSGIPPRPACAATARRKRTPTRMGRSPGPVPPFPSASRRHARPPVTHLTPRSRPPWRRREWSDRTWSGPKPRCATPSRPGWRPPFWTNPDTSRAPRDPSPDDAHLPVGGEVLDPDVALVAGRGLARVQGAPPGGQQGERQPEAVPGQGPPPTRRRRTSGPRPTCRSRPWTAPGCPPDTGRDPPVIRIPAYLTEQAPWERWSRWTRKGTPRPRAARASRVPEGWAAARTWRASVFGRLGGRGTGRRR